MNHPKVTTIAEAFRLAAKIAGDLQVKRPYIADVWKNGTDPVEGIAYTHADNIAEELTALAEEYQDE